MAPELLSILRTLGKTCDQERRRANEDILVAQGRRCVGRKKWWGLLTDDDLDRIDGSVDELAGTLQEKYGYGREDAEREIERRLGAA
jgi:uncharacterized protein YjbJ (UPF0337 family)